MTGSCVNCKYYKRDVISHQCWHPEHVTKTEDRVIGHVFKDPGDCYKLNTQAEPCQVFESKEA